MRVVNSCILELREYKGRRIVCQLKLDCSILENANNEEPQNFHWLEKKHWENFDAQLEQLIDNISDKTRIRNKTVEKTFQLHDEVDVQVRNSAASLKTLLYCLGHLTLEQNENTLALDFLVRHRKKRKYDVNNSDILGLEEFLCNADELEYHPLPVSLPVSPEASSLPYVPTKIGSKNLNLCHTIESDICNIDDEDRYSPELPKVCTLPVYTPKPIDKEKDIFANSSEDDDAILSANKLTKSTISSAAGDEKKSRIRTSKEQKDDSPDIILIRSQDAVNHLKKGEKNIATRRQNHRHDNQIKNSHAPIGDEKPTNSRLVKGQDNSQGEMFYEKEESQDDDIDLEKYVKPSKDIAGKNLEEKGKEKTVRSDSKNDGNKNVMRRSNRSPTKSSHFEVEDFRDLRSKNKNKKRSKAVSKTMKECFGSDAESDDFTERTPMKTAPKIRLGSAQLASSVKKRKREEKNERSCQQEKQSMSKWLSKKKPEELDKSPKKTSKSTKSRVKESKTSADSSGGIVRRIVYPTPEEIANNERREKEQMKVNRKMKILLEDLIQVPKKVEILSLNSMSADEILNTFPKYKEHLDSIFNKLRSKPKVTGYNGINHYSVIELIDNEKQLKIMNKLGEVYENESEGTSMYSTLFANALMPEWLVNIFKDKYKFSHSEAVLRLQDQQQYMQYMDVEDHH